jgi:hypothetical protein
VEEFAIINQRPIDRTSNVISRPELGDTDEVTSHLEKGFLEELQRGASLRQG